MAEILSIKNAEISGLITLKKKDMPFQSYLSDNQLEHGILPQAPAAPIVQSSIVVDGAPEVEQTEGYALIALPTNETPITVQFLSGGGGSAYYTLAPGQMIQPSDKPFTGFKWGLPFGWLGGGAAAVAVLKERGARLDIGGGARPDVVFHRFRASLEAMGTNVLEITGPNLPLRFPWPNARSSYASDFYSTFALQPGKPFLSVEPTRTLCRLRSAASADPVSIRVEVYNAEMFDLDFDEVLTNEFSFQDVVFPGVGAVADTNTVYPMIELPSGLMRIGGDNATMCFKDLDGVFGGATFIDVIRFGRVS